MFGQNIAPKYSNEFLQIGVGARALSMGNSVIASTENASAGYWNPAGLANIESSMQFDLMHAEYFAGISKYDYMGWAMPIDENNYVGATFLRFGVDQIMNTPAYRCTRNVDYDRITYFLQQIMPYFILAHKMKI